jgi:hypothetical protein
LALVTGSYSALTWEDPLAQTIAAPESITGLFGFIYKTGITTAVFVIFFLVKI